MLRSGDSLAKEDAGGFWHGDVWTPEKVALASGKEIESAQVQWGQDIGSSPRMRVDSGNDPESWGQALSGFYMTVFKWSSRRKWGSSQGRGLGPPSLPPRLASFPPLCG